MARTIKIMTALAIASLLAGEAYAQAPVRNGLRRTGEAAANVVQGTAQATGNVIRGTADVAGNVARGTVNAAGNIAHGTAEATGDVLRGTARATRNVVTAPFGGPAYDGRYAAGYGGVDAGNAAASGQAYEQGQAGAQGQFQSTGQAYALHRDGSGREWICDNGRRVYVDGAQSSQTAQIAPAPAGANQANWQQDASQQPSAQGVQGATYNEQSSANAQGNWNQGQASVQANGQAQASSQPPAPPSAPNPQQ